VAYVKVFESLAQSQGESGPRVIAFPLSKLLPGMDEPPTAAVREPLTTGEEAPLLRAFSNLKARYNSTAMMMRGI
jgi:hypothetical protein